jgi:hypothetical protein
MPFTTQVCAAQVWKYASDAGRVVGFDMYVIPPTVAICDGGRPEIACGTSTSMPSVASSGSCTSSVWVGSQPPSLKSITRKCGCSGSAFAIQVIGGHIRSVVADSPSFITLRRVIVSFHVLMARPPPRPSR